MPRGTEAHAPSRTLIIERESMAFFADKEGSLHYLVRGHGEPLVLIHGLGGSGADWAFQVAALENRFRVIIPDLPGSGHSPPPRGEYTIAGFAASLWSLLEHLEVSQTNSSDFRWEARSRSKWRPSALPAYCVWDSSTVWRLTGRIIGENGWKRTLRQPWSGCWECGARRG